MGSFLPTWARSTSRRLSSNCPWRRGFRPCSPLRSGWDTAGSHRTGRITTRRACRRRGWWRRSFKSMTCSIAWWTRRDGLPLRETAWSSRRRRNFGSASWARRSTTRSGAASRPCASPVRSRCGSSRRWTASTSTWRTCATAPPSSTSGRTGSATSTASVATRTRHESRTSATCPSSR